MWAYNLSQMNWRCGGQNDNDDDDDGGSGQPKRTDLFVKAEKMNNNINKKVHMRIMFSSRSLLLLHLITYSLTEYENCRKIQKNALTIPITVGIFFFFSQTQKKKNMKMESFIEIMKCEWKRWRRHWLCVFVWISTSNEIIVITLIKINYWNALCTN